MSSTGSDYRTAQPASVCPVGLEHTGKGCHLKACWSCCPVTSSGLLDLDTVSPLVVRHG